MGQSVNVTVQFLASFSIAQSFMSLMCRLEVNSIYTLLYLIYILQVSTTKCCACLLYIASSSVFLANSQGLPTCHSVFAKATPRVLRIRLFSGNVPTCLALMQWGTFLFFAGCVALMTLCVTLLLPETKGVPLEEINKLWESHSTWSKIVGLDKGPEQSDADNATATADNVEPLWT